jgi:hypothetical protein
MAYKQVCKLACIVLAGVLSACSTTVERVTDPAKLKGLAFLQPGTTQRQEVEARFGPPLNVYEKDRVATYRVEQSKDGFRATLDFRSGYSLVLHYRADDVLERWSLVHK